MYPTLCQTHLPYWPSCKQNKTVRVLVRVKVKIKNNFLICALQLDASCWTGLIKIIKNAVYHSSLLWPGINNAVYCSSLSGDEIWGWSIHPPCFQWACPHGQVVRWFLFGFYQLQFQWLSTILVLWGYEATPLWAVRVPLSVSGSIPYQGGRCMLIPPPDMEGYLPSTPPHLVLLTMTQFCEWSHWSQGPLSNAVYGQWYHFLSQMHVFLSMSTAMSHYLWSSPIFSGCSSRYPWQKS